MRAGTSTLQNVDADSLRVLSDAVGTRMLTVTALSQYATHSSGLIVFTEVCRSNLLAVLFPFRQILTDTFLHCRDRSIGLCFNMAYGSGTATKFLHSCWSA